MTGFAGLEQRMAERLTGITLEDGASTIVVCPSVSFPAVELRKIVAIQHYEERLLFLTLLLQRPDLQMVYPSSVPIDEAIIDYYLSRLDDPEEARSRLHLIAVDDPDPRGLTEKLLERPDLVEAIRTRVDDPATSFVLPFNVTPAEARLAEQLGIGLYGPDPDLVWLGTKSGARAVAAEAGVPVFDGAADLFSDKDVESAIGDIVSARPDAVAVVAKLNNGFSGQGNVVFELATLRTPLRASPAVFCAAEESWESYFGKVTAEGAVVEELARAPGIVSPSVQLRILPGGRHEVVSTHDQILGGPDDQVYLGCRFPADAAYRADITDAARRVAAALAARGVIGSFGIDFVVVPDRGIFLSEINLRMGGTTHPFLMARYVTGGTYDQSRGELLVGGGPRVYKASDNLKSPAYVGLTPGVVIDAVADAGLAFDPATGTGATLHLLGALRVYGKYGLVCIARSPAEADELYDRVVATVDALVAAR